ncbi:nicotinamide-nucleotide amidohydrolase family protein [Actinomyces sp. 2119]|uniref:Nicotinamide-nucleotide amidohydrolase family protein n=2 Tax=Actinomyces TaxID=1654 RepID=A0ABN5PR92_9ACTO|nr:MULTISPECIES: nicotinamide-nucleotide amidohydrolase family protein [Actinomyces]AYD90915.1 nicotinamide-nucleotide amidohydrolase family protein [Actinomyces lilanjuaniae]RJF42654.1 nicotinamide-nucleotide amidohydrolase family protein [Actinomyces sp. 2119]
MTEELRQAAERLLDEAGRRRLTLAVAESLTGGMVASALADVPGASRVLVGAVVAYAMRVKSQVLGVDPVRLAEVGPVDSVVAEQMAAGVSRLMGADLGVATTGVAGPGGADGHEAGTVHLAVVSGWGTRLQELHLPGGRTQVRCTTTLRALEMVTQLLTSGVPGEGGRQAKEG